MHTRLMFLYITMSMIRWIRKAELCPPLSWHCRTENFLFFTDFSFPAVPPLSPSPVAPISNHSASSVSV
jgi:hypothetical protein